MARTGSLPRPHTTWRVTPSGAVHQLAGPIPVSAIDLIPAEELAMPVPSLPPPAPRIAEPPRPRSQTSEEIRARQAFRGEEIVAREPRRGRGRPRKDAPPPPPPRVLGPLHRCPTCRALFDHRNPVQISGLCYRCTRTNAANLMLPETETIH